MNKSNKINPQNRPPLKNIGETQTKPIEPKKTSLEPISSKEVVNVLKECLHPKDQYWDATQTAKKIDDLAHRLAITEGAFENYQDILSIINVLNNLKNTDPKDDTESFRTLRSNERLIDLLEKKITESTSPDQIIKYLKTLLLPPSEEEKSSHYPGKPLEQLTKIVNLMDPNFNSPTREELKRIIKDLKAEKLEKFSQIIMNLQAKINESLTIKKPSSLISIYNWASSTAHKSISDKTIVKELDTIAQKVRAYGPDHLNDALTTLFTELDSLTEHYSNDEGFPEVQQSIIKLIKVLIQHSHQSIDEAHKKVFFDLKEYAEDHNNPELTQVIDKYLHLATAPATRV